MPAGHAASLTEATDPGRFAPESPAPQGEGFSVLKLVSGWYHLNDPAPGTKKAGELNPCGGVAFRP